MAPISVLLVDDNATFRRVASRFLEEESGREVLVVGAASRGEDALARAADLRPRVVLVDLRMPGLGGLDTIPRLRRLLPESGIIALTLLDGEDYRRAALTQGADAFVSKATMSTDLLPAIRRVAEGGHPRELDHD